MNINSLIRKHGEPAKQNGQNIHVFLNGERLSSYRAITGFKEYTGMRTLAVLIKQEARDDDVYVVNGRNWLVFEAQEVRHKGKRVYSDVVLFEDDFTHEITLFDQEMKKHGCNLPSRKEEPKVTAMARLKTVKASEFLQMAMHHDGKPPTHVFTTKYTEGFKSRDVIAWGERAFEVLSVENVNEQDRLLSITTIEVLNG